VRCEKVRAWLGKAFGFSSRCATPIGQSVIINAMAATSPPFHASN
jgi:hypothetical protein